MPTPRRPSGLVIPIAFLALLLLAGGLGVTRLLATPASPRHAGEPPVEFHGGKAPAAPVRARMDSPAPGVAPGWGWWNVTSESTARPPIFWFTQGTWDSADGYLLLYGGDNFAGTNLAQTWAYSGGTWSQLTTNGTPGGLDGPALAYDPLAGEVVMYGGLQSYSPFKYTNLTWFYSDGNWTSAALNPTPPPRLAGSMVYDPDLGGVVLFGGYNNSDPSGGTLLNDLWLFKAGAWSRVAASNPPPVRTWAPLAYDAVRHELVQYSGVNTASSCIGDTWTFANSTWTHVPRSAGGPPILCANALGYDPDLGRVVLTGGLNSTTTAANNQTWSFNGSGWNAVNASGAPGTHEYGVSAWDPAEHSFVVAGGSSTYTATDLLSMPLTVVNLTGPTTSEAGQTVLFEAGAIGGVPSRDYSWSWGDGTVTSGGPNASHAYASAHLFTVRLTVTDAASNVATDRAYINVSAGPNVGVSAASSAADVGVPINFTAVAPGATAGDSYHWTFGDGTGGTGAVVDHAYGSVGNYTATLVVTDAVGGSGSASTTVAIHPALTVHLVDPSGAEVGVPVALAAAISGGTAPLAYRWLFPDGGVATTAGATHRFPTSGPQSVDLLVSDAVNASVSLQETVNVTPAVQLHVSGVTALTAGSTGTWIAEVSDGVGPFLVLWTFPDGSSSQGNTSSFPFATSGNFAVHLRVTDALGGSANATENVTVSPSASTLPGGTIAGLPTVVLGVVAVVAVAATIALMAWRGRRGPPRTPDE